MRLRSSNPDAQGMAWPRTGTAAPGWRILVYAATALICAVVLSGFGIGVVEILNRGSMSAIVVVSAHGGGAPPPSDRDQPPLFRVRRSHLDRIAKHTAFRHHSSSPRLYRATVRRIRRPGRDRRNDMASSCFRSSCPDPWNSPRPHSDPTLRRMKHGAIQPMEADPGVLQWLRKRLRSDAKLSSCIRH